jgi:hypothetical protein
MDALRKHYVTFLSPGTFVSESTTKGIAVCDPDLAKTMAMDIKERYGATPYGFYFTTRERGPDDFDSKEVGRSPGIYYLGGTIRTAEEVLAGDDPSESILRSNVRLNGFKRILTNDNSWRFTTALKDEDVVLNFDGETR